MKNARPTKAESSVTPQGAQIIARGRLPVRTDTVRADVLCRLLNHERMDSLDAVSEASTTRLAAVVHCLCRDYGWAIEATDKAAGCRDGRVAWVSEYWLPAETIAAAMADGAGAWCDGVRVARRARRTKAAQAMREAARANAARRASRANHPGQSSLFEGCVNG